MIRLRLLGGAGLVVSSEQYAHQVLVQPKRFALLGYLALESRRALLRRDAVLAMFWPDRGEAAARSALSQALSFLRRSLGPGVIVTRGDDEVGVDHGGLRCDVAQFEEAFANGDFAAALDLYAGDLLPSFHVDGAPAVGQWLEDERRRLKGIAFDCASKLSDAAMRAGDLPTALASGRDALRLAPFEESAMRRVLAALEALGERAQAVQEYELFVKRLQDELELSPSPDLPSRISQLRHPVQGAPGPVALSAMADVETAATERELPGAPPEGSQAPVHAMASVSGEAVWTPTRPLIRRGLTLLAATGLLATGVYGFREWYSGKSPTVAATRGTVGTVGAIRPIGPGVAITPIGNVDAAPEPAAHRVAVIPFENLTGRAELAYVGNLAADEILAGVLQAGHTGVDRSAVRVLLDATGHAPANLMRLLVERRGATIIVDGSYSLEHDTLRIRARVIDASTERTLFVIEPERAVRGDPLVALRPLRERVLGGLLTSAEARRITVALRPPLADAYRTYEKVAHGVPCANARPALERAIALDSTFVDAYEMLLDCIVIDRYQAHVLERQAITARLTRVRTLLSAYDQRRLAYFEELAHGDHAAALSHARALYQLTHSPKWAYVAGTLAKDLLRPWLAIEYLKQSDSSYFERGVAGQFRALASAYHLAGDYQSALRTVERGRAAAPAEVWGEEFMTAYGSLRQPPRVLAYADSSLGRLSSLEELRVWLNPFLRPVLILRRLGDVATAHALIDRYIAAVRAAPASAEQPQLREALLAYAFNLRDAPDSTKLYLLRSEAGFLPPRANLGQVARRAIWYLRAGDSTVARTLADSLLTASSPAMLMGQREYWRAALLAELGQREEAMRLLRQAGSMGSMQWGWTWADALSRLHGYPPFEAFIKPRR